MKLYYTPGACSLSPHIALREAGLTFDLVKVDLQSKKTESGEGFRAVNPSGYVPALALDDGVVLTEGPAIVQYIADRVPAAQLAPANGTLERYRLQQWLNFIGTELHKNFSPLFNPAANDAWKAAARQNLVVRMEHVAQQLKSTPYLLGERLTVADIYLFVVLSWAGYVDVDLSPWPVLQQFSARVAARPAVQAALKAEGLLKG